jgi:hypothetical protein
MASGGRRRAQRSDRHDDPQPWIGALDVALAAHLLDLLARLGGRRIAVLHDPLMRGALDVAERKAPPALGISSAGLRLQ